jgi:outer membrane protein
MPISSLPGIEHHAMVMPKRFRPFPVPFTSEIVMSRKTYFCLLLGLLLSANSQAEMKIGFVNVARLLEKAPQAEKAKKDLEREFSPRDKKLAAEAKEIKAMEERLAKDAAVMSESERDKLDKEILNRKREAKRTQDEFREDFNLRRNEELTKLQKEIFEAIQSLAKEDGFDLLLTDGVVYASEEVDVTSKVETKLLAGAKDSKK